MSAVDMAVNFYEYKVINTTASMIWDFPRSYDKILFGLY